MSTSGTDKPSSNVPAEPAGLDFVRRIVETDNETGKWGGRVATRFPPEPNGYLHIGHAKSICLNFGIADEYGGLCNLRYDDTNPAKEEEEYVRSIEQDVKWLGFTWGGKFWASDYFQTMYDYAVELIKKGKAYVDDQTADQIRQTRGTLTRPGTESPFRNRAPEENVDLFDRMRRGEFPDGSKTLRAKIDMASPNLNLRDPVMYRILHESHHNTGDKWCIYPMYDWAHGFEDSVEKITHSICTLEFENHRPLYDWFIDTVNEGRAKRPSTLSETIAAINHWFETMFRTEEYNTQRRDYLVQMASELGEENFAKLWELKDPDAILELCPEFSATHSADGTRRNIRTYVGQFQDFVQIWHPQQIEFARLNLTYTMLSKRNLLTLVNEKVVNGWDDPRMPTISGFRRKGYTPEAVRAFCKHIGVNKFNSTVDIQVLENFLRDDLNKRAPRTMAVLRPLKLVITNYPEGQTEELDAVNNPEDPTAGSRKVPFSREIYIERDDFAEVPPPKYFRLYPGNEVRLRYAYFVKCTNVFKDASGNITEVHCTYDPATRGGDSPDGRKVKGTIHWVDAKHAVDAEVRLYDHLFSNRDPMDVPEGKDWKVNLNPNSLEIISHAKVEPAMTEVVAGSSYQFERTGYFCVDRDSTPGKPVFNRSVSLKESWSKEQQKGKK